MQLNKQAEIGAVSYTHLNTALKALGDYEKQLKKGMNPVFKSTDIGMKEKMDCWE